MYVCTYIYIYMCIYIYIVLSCYVSITIIVIVKRVGEDGLHALRRHPVSIYAQSTY